MKRILTLIVLCVSFLEAGALNWKPQTNEGLRNDMFAFVERFIDSTSDKRLAKELESFLSRQKGIAESQPYVWIQQTHDFVDRVIARYPAELSDGGNCSLERRNLLLLRDYPMHADDKPQDAPQELKDTYENSVKGFYAEAEAEALRWLSSGRSSKKLDLFKVYNMGFIFRSQGQTVGIDLQWSGDRKQMEELASHLDVLFITHPHGDHFEAELLEVMIEAGKPVVLPCDLLPEVSSPFKVVVGGDNPYGKTVGGVDFKSMMGNQGPRTPCNVYLLSVGNWNIVHNGDNAVPEAETYLSSEKVDVLVSACWNGVKDTMNKIKASPEGKDCIWLSAHENEWRHTVDHRESYEELFTDENRLGDPDYDYLRTVVLDAAGDMFTVSCE